MTCGNYAGLMSNEPVPIGPDRDAMIRLIRETWPDAVVATIESAAFFSLDEKQRWISIMNPSETTLQEGVIPLLTEAHDRLVAQRERQRPLRSER